jgi:hypothetical protein
MREGGLEPPNLTAPDPKSGVSANSTTPAYETSKEADRNYIEHSQSVACSALSYNSLLFEIALVKHRRRPVVFHELRLYKSPQRAILRAVVIVLLVAELRLLAVAGWSSGW